MEVKKEIYSRQLRIDFSRCKLCPYRSKSMFLLIGHLRLHRLRTSEDFFSCHSNPPQNHKCKKCSFETDLKTTLQHHIDATHCDKIAPKSEEAVKTYKCKGCSFESCSLLVFSRHFYSAANDATCGLFVCSLRHCSYTTTNRHYFQAHSIMKHLQGVKGEFYTCDQCGFVSKKRYALMTHAFKEHADPDDGFWCELCSSRFLTRMQLEVHEVGKHAFTHLKPLQDEVKYKCNFCSFGTTYKACMKRHAFIRHSRKKRNKAVQIRLISVGKRKRKCCLNETLVEEAWRE